jgi:hexosaminidase
MAALSEVLWTGSGSHTFENFYYRLIEIEKRFDQLDWAYAPGSFTVSIQPEFKSRDKGFYINLTSEKPDKTIRFTTNGKDPAIDSTAFSGSIMINQTTTIKAALFINEEQAGLISEKTIFSHKAMGKKVKYNNMYKKRYAGTGAITLVDGITGTTVYNDGFWQGWEKNDLDVIIDLEKVDQLNKVSIGFLESHDSWIFLPTEVSFSFSNDGISFELGQKINVKNGKKNGKPNRYLVEAFGLKTQARYVKVKAKNQRICPEWHVGAGEKTWLFCDEIVIE